MASGKVVTMRRRFRPNLALFIFLLIVIYIVVLAWGFLTKKHISIYEVNTTEISDDSPLHGLILRTEEVVSTKKDGYVNYYNAEGNRIGIGDVVYTLDTNGGVSDILKELQQSNPNAESVTAMREVISSFQNSFSMSAYSRLSDFQFDVNNVFFEKNNGNLYSDLNNALKESGQSKNFKKYRAKMSGVISYSIDGYENIRKEDVTPEMLDQYGQLTRQQTRTSEMTVAGTPVYKLVTDNTWSLIVKLNDEYYSELQEKDSVRITVNKDNISFNAAVELWDKDDVHFARLTTSRFMERYINDRFLQFEFNLKSAAGLKIPNSSILTKDYYMLPADVVTKGDGGNGVIRQVTDAKGQTTKQFIGLGHYFVIDQQYCVDDSVVTGGDILMDHATGENYIVNAVKPLFGVYCVNQGFCEFRSIDILYQNKEYTIVSDTTVGGLSAYDHIVVDAASLGDDDFIE